jgi:hypothetical protein
MRVRLSGRAKASGIKLDQIWIGCILRS